MGMYVPPVMVHTYVHAHIYTETSTHVYIPIPIQTYEYKQTFTCIYVHIKSTNACTHMYRHAGIPVKTHINGNKKWRV